MKDKKSKEKISVIERNQTEQGFRDSAYQLSAVIESVGEGITFSDAQGKFLVYNLRMQEITGFTQDEANNSGDFTKLLYPDPQEHQKALQRLQEIREHKLTLPLEVETTIQAKDGTKRVLWVSTRAMKFRDQEMFLSIYRDITQRKLAEEELKKAKEKLEIQTWGLERANKGIKVLYKELEEKSAELKRLNAELQDLSIKDAHTQIYNYRYLIERLTFELKRSRRHILPLSILMVDIDYFKSVNDVYGHQYGDMILKELAQYLNNFCRSTDMLTRYGGEEFTIVLPDTNKAGAIQFGERLLETIRKHSFDSEGNKIRLKISIGIASFPEDGDKAGSVDGLIAMADKALLRAKEMGGDRLSTLKDVGIDIEEIMGQSEKNNIDKLRKKISEMSNRVNQSLLESIYAFTKTIEAKDYRTVDHAKSMVSIVTAIAKELNIPSSEIGNIEHAAVLHDLGKIGIPDSILQKPGKLSAEEYEIIKRHPQIGADIIRPIHFLKDLVPIILYHHERFDGLGYSAGLKGREIPLGARIVAVADVYQALISDRPYRKAYNKEEAIDIIKQNSGTQLDPDIVKAFVKGIKFK